MMMRLVADREIVGRNRLRVAAIDADEPRGTYLTHDVVRTDVERAVTNDVHPVLAREPIDVFGKDRFIPLAGVIDVQLLLRKNVDTKCLLAFMQIEIQQDEQLSVVHADLADRPVKSPFRLQIAQ
jgi:hypothetical protein